MRRFAAILAVALVCLSQWVSPALALTEIARIYIDQSSLGIAVDPSRGRAYAAGEQGHLVVIDTVTNTHAGAVWVGGALARVVVDEVTGYVFVSNSDTLSVAVVDPTTLTIIATLSPGGLDLAIDRSRRLLYASAHERLGVFDLDTLTTVADVASNGRGFWWGLALDPTRQRLYIEDFTFDDWAVRVMDLSDYSLVARIPVAGQTRIGMTIDVVRNLVYVPNFFFGGSVSVIDGASLAVIETVAVGDFPWDLLLDGDTLYAAVMGSPDFNSGALVILSTVPHLQIVETLAFDGKPAALALTQDPRRLYVTDWSGRNVRVLAFAVPNARPVIDSVTIAPTDPRTNDTLTAAVVAHDDDGDTLTYSYQWLRNGADIAGATSASLDLSIAGNGDHGDAISVRVVASDGEDFSSPFTSTGIIVLNTAPVIDSVAIAPTGPRTNDTLTAAVVAHDDDGDTLTYSYQWLRDGVAIAGATSASLDLSQTGSGDRGNAITVRVVASDGTDESTPVTSAAVTVLNTAPAAAVRLSTRFPSTRDTLVASASVSDTDGDSITLTYVWKVNGVTRQTTTTTALSDSFDLRRPGNGNPGDVVVVYVTPSDGLEAGATATEGALVRGGP